MYDGKKKKSSTVGRVQAEKIYEIYLGGRGLKKLEYRLKPALFVCVLALQHVVMIFLYRAFTIFLSFLFFQYSEWLAYFSELRTGEQMQKKKGGARGKNVLEEEYKTTYMPYLIPFYCSLCTFPNTSEVHFTSLMLKKKKKEKKEKKTCKKSLSCIQQCIRLTGRHSNNLTITQLNNCISPFEKENFITIKGEKEKENNKSDRKYGQMGSFPICGNVNN